MTAGCFDGPNEMHMRLIDALIHCVYWLDKFYIYTFRLSTRTQQIGIILHIFIYYKLADLSKNTTPQWLI